MRKSTKIKLFNIAEWVACSACALFVLYYCFVPFSQIGMFDTGHWMNTILRDHPIFRFFSFLFLTGIATYLLYLYMEDFKKNHIKK